MKRDLCLYLSHKAMRELRFQNLANPTSFQGVEYSGFLSQGIGTLTEAMPAEVAA